MALLLRLASRNVKRNIKATFMCGLSISLAAAVLLITFSLSRGIETDIVQKSIRFESGAVSVGIDKKTGSFQNKEKGDLLLSQLVSELEGNQDIHSYSFRIYPGRTFLYHKENSQNIKVIGISEQETQLLSDMLLIQKGTSDFSKNSRALVISSGIADEYGIDIGDECSLMLQSIDGSVNMDDFIVEGIFRYTSQLDKFRVYMNYNEAKALYNANLPSEIIINLHELQKAEEVKETIAQSLHCEKQHPEGEIECRGLTIASYIDRTGMAKTLSKFNKFGLLSIAVFLIAISFVGVWSMQVENINERSREIGAMLTFGFTKKAIKRLFAYESAYISLMFFSPTFAVIAGLILWINLYEGIWLGDSASFAFGSGVVNPRLTLNDSLNVLLISILYPLAATLLSIMAINKKNSIDLLSMKN